jgi:hypothetical protein
MKLPQLSLRDLFWLVALAAIGCGPSATPVPLPPLAEIAAVTAKIDKSPWMSECEFEVPTESWESIFAELHETAPDPTPSKWVTLGELRIVTTKEENKFHVELYWTESAPGAFSVSKGETRTEGERRCYYRGGDSARLISALKSAQQVANTEPNP